VIEMKIIFFGTSVFAVKSLEKLLSSGHEVMACVTQPDKKKGRALKVLPPPVKEAAVKAGLPVLQPGKLDGGFAEVLKAMRPEIFVVIAYGHILKRSILEIPSKYSVNVHASLLPKYRGAAPINWAVANGEKKTGVTVIRMNEMMDAGDIIARAEMDILDTDDASILDKKLSEAGARLLLKTLDDISAGRERFTAQDENSATLARKLRKEDGMIDWTACAGEIRDKVRGLQPWPGAYTSIHGKILNLWNVSIAAGQGKPGEVLKASDGELIVGAADGSVRINEIQLEAKRRMDTQSFLRGFRGIARGDVLGA
jgi:methionyl-tRNA formyltransferase